ncbi:MAG: ATP-dependent Clp protease adaptor ClpS [Desulfobulbaceae bacterium]|nr:ATP-dependent Clp protease adaptor ClpS [Desulfobulbaceae bacterium]
MSKEDTIFKEDSLTDDLTDFREPPLFKVILHNDDYTTMDFVVMILENIFGKNIAEATQIMLNIHHQGRGIAGIFTKEIGETKIIIVHQLAKDSQFPLKCSLEKI